MTAPLPFATDTSAATIITACLQFCTGRPRTDAVYVLECQPNTHPTATAAGYFGQVDHPCTAKVAGAKRLLYVGVTTNLHR